MSQKGTWVHRGKKSLGGLFLCLSGAIRTTHILTGRAGGAEGGGAGEDSVEVRVDRRRV